MLNNDISKRIVTWYFPVIKTFVEGIICILLGYLCKRNGADFLCSYLGLYLTVSSSLTILWQILIGIYIA